MGQSISHSTFSEEDKRLYEARLDDSLTVLEQLLQQSGFGHGDSSIGAELEMVLVDDQCHAIPVCDEILRRAGDDRLTAEINRYNLEVNLTPVSLGSDSFGKIESEMLSVAGSLNQLAGEQGVRVIPVGILPTLRHEDLHACMITPDKRYQTLSRLLRKNRGEKFSIRLKGREKVAFQTDSVAPEGANTSLQIHYRAHPDRFVDLFNSIQLVTPLVLGLGANSPFLLGRQIWHETRIGLFKQSIDGRNLRKRQLQLPARVHFGHGWLRKSALELFAETVSLYPPLLPICSDEDPMATFKEGKTPALSELELQMGTVWPWNRPVFDAGDQPHVRVELRSLPAGPSAIDMMANAALAIGLAEGLLENIEGLVTSMPYDVLQRNLMVAARNGIECDLLWPSGKSNRLVEKPLIALADELLPAAYEGLSKIGIAAEQQSRYFGCIESRLCNASNGATWQISAVSALRQRGFSRQAALKKMLDIYADNCLSNDAVADWRIP